MEVSRGAKTLMWLVMHASAAQPQDKLIARSEVLEGRATPRVNFFRQHEQRLFCTLWLTRESFTTGYQVCLHTSPAKENKRQKWRQEKAQKEKDCRRRSSDKCSFRRTGKSFQGKKKTDLLVSTARRAAIRGTRSVFIGILLTLVIFKMVNATRSSRRTIEHVTRY